MMNAIVASEIETTDARCPVTRSSRVVRLGNVDGHDIWRCPESATDFVWPPPSDADLKRYYDRAEWFEGGEVGGYANYDRQTDFSLPMVAGLLDRYTDDGVARYVLDVGCGYGTHLALAAERGWKCFGVELSDHARKTAIERHGAALFVVEEVEELIPHEFDLVLMLDVLEHVADPYALMFRLFNRGLIGPRTRVVISTPNARSADAVRDGARWIYRHPPSHLVYYSARSLRRLMGVLQFEDVDVVGTSEVVDGTAAYPDEDLAADESLSRFAGLLCEATGSRFFAFMLERYVPGTWSKLAEYEHVPRYQFARRFAADAAVLDFGCGTGYGSRVLADVASDVLGLDIDADALAWARFWHDPSRLRFERHADLGATLPTAHFDLVTCFEMIEHVDHAMQIATIASLARVVKPTGKLLISTPNPAVTANYGENPFHLREMTEPQFVELLAPHFAHVAIYRQWVRPSILIGSEAIPSSGVLTADRLSSERMVDEPPAFVAVCSHQPLTAVEPFCTFDGSFDMILAETEAQKTLTGLRFDNYLLREARDQAGRQAAVLRDDVQHLGDTERANAEALAQQAETIERMRASFDEQARNIDALQAELGSKEDALRGQAEDIAALHANFAQQQANIGELRAALADKEAALAEQAATIADFHESFARLQANIDDVRAALADKEAAFVEQAATNEALKAELVAKQAALDHQAANLAEMHGRLTVQQADIDALGAASIEQQASIAGSQRTIESQSATLREQEDVLADLRQNIHALQDQLAERDGLVERQHAHARHLEAVIAERTAEKEEWRRHYAALEMTRFVRLARLLHGNSGSRAPVIEATYLIAGGLIPGSLKSRLAPAAAKLRGLFAKPPPATAVFAPYVVKPPSRVRASRPRVLHVIANFMTGGSSRLVVDLLEHLGGEYEQHVLTSFVPSPVNYVGVDLTEVRDLHDAAAIRDAMARFNPHIVHVHYWGDCDEPWYRAVFGVAAERACPIVQNINTPVVPFADVALARNIFVSRYVLDHFGDGQAHNTVIYPGSDFTLFAPSRRPRRPHGSVGCIGMVYRLERDKLDEAAIEPFIEAARAMPGLKCLIVGGGSLLQPFKDRVHAGGLDDAFEFTGYVSYETLPALYKRMDVFVAPIWKESFGQVSAFAMNMGIPVIGYDVGAIPEIVADPSLVAPARDAKALATIAVNLVRDDEARASIGVANRQRAARMFSVEAMIGSYRDLYRDLMKR